MFWKKRKERQKRNRAYWALVYAERDALSAKAKVRPDLTGREVHCGKCGCVSKIISSDDVMQRSRRFDSEFYVTCAGCEQSIVVMKSAWVPPLAIDRNGNLNRECSGSYTTYKLSDRILS